jgi:hypothetical protein
VLSLALCVACGGKAEKDGPVVEAPSAGGSGAATASGGSGGAAVTPTTGGAVATTGGVLATGGVVAAGGQTTSTGGAPPRPEPGTELWFSRGYVVLSAHAYWDLLTQLFSVTTPAPLDRSAWGPLSFSATVPRASKSGPSDMPVLVLAEVSDEQLLEAIGCSEADAECAELAATRFARRMWRRDVTPAESAALTESFSSATPGTESVALRALVRSILEAPDAYALPALGTEVSRGKYELSELELAGLLAISVTGQPPDEALLDAAAEGALDLDAELDRLLEGDGARRHLALLIHRWFSLREARQLWIYEDEPALADSMVEETRLFIENVVFDEPAPVSSLATAPFSFVDGRLAELYGLDSPSVDRFERVDLGDTRRRGIPGQASYLTSTAYKGGSSYVQRAHAPLKLICEELPPPPSSVAPLPPLEPFAGSERTRLDEMTADPACASCHRVMNPILYSFGHFDGRGAHTDVDRSGFPVDSSGAVTTFDGSSFDFEDSADLMDQLAKTPQYSECFVRNAVGWLVGFGNGDPAVLDYVARAHEPGDDERVLDAIRTFVNSDHFRYRKP